MPLKFLILMLLILIIRARYVYSWSYNPYCWLAECCNKDYVPGDVNRLRKVLKERVYGQHLVDAAVDALAAHWDRRYRASKALTLSFHGWPGSGKNYVSKFIAESLYKHGTKSKYVHHFIGRIHFPLNERAEEYKRNLYSWLKGNITNCEKQLFIFDEVDKMPPTVLNGIKPMIDYRDVVDGVDYTQAIFIFLSNTGAGLINEHYEDKWNKGNQRENLTLKDFENLIAQGAFNEEGWLNKEGFFNNIARKVVYNLNLGSVYHGIVELLQHTLGPLLLYLLDVILLDKEALMHLTFTGGFHHSDTIKSNLIDHYIPFLPMQEQHVIECIKDEFKQRHVNYPNPIYVKEVLEFIEWGPDRSKLFSKTGCKRISSKVALMVAKHYGHLFKNEL